MDGTGRVVIAMDFDVVYTMYEDMKEYENK